MGGLNRFAPAQQAERSQPLVCRFRRIAVEIANRCPRSRRLFGPAAIPCDRQSRPLRDKVGEFDVAGRLGGARAMTAIWRRRPLLGPAEALGCE